MPGALTRSHPPRVLIVGAGIGGLCLAQGLRRAGLDVVVFERAHDPVTDRQGYGFSINDDGDAALLRCLPPDLYQLYRATASRAPIGDFVLFSSDRREIFRRPLPPSTGVVVNRQTLKEVLLIGLMDAVRFGKRFVGFQTHDDGLVDAHFADGTVASGHLLVGADGADSVVRAQLLPDAEFDDLGQSIYGRSPVTPELRAAVPTEFFTGMCRVKDPTGLMLGVGAFVKAFDDYEGDQPAVSDRRITLAPDYLRWTLSLRDTNFLAPHDRLSADRGLQQHAQSLVADWHPDLRAVVEEAEGSATFAFRIAVARPVGRWRESAVTLLGDSIHLMAPGRGEGANTALRDAALLAAVVSYAINEKPISLSTAKRRYETAMLSYGFAASANSVRPFFASASTRRG